MIHPGSAVILRFLFGHLACATAGRKRKVFKAPDDVRIVSEDPIFSVATNRKKTVVRVLVGSALVSGVSGSKSAVVVGPGQQTIVRAGKDPTKPNPIELSPVDLVDKRKLGPHEPQPDFTRPTSKGSPNLTRIFRSQVLAVGFDQKSSSDRGTPIFVRTYLGFLTASWKLRLSLQIVTTSSALRELADGKLDLVVASTTAFGFDSLPLFAETPTKTWSMFVNPDKVYVEGLSRFLVAAVNASRYDGLYRSAFHRSPNYEPLHTVLFPK